MNPRLRTLALPLAIALAISLASARPCGADEPHPVAASRPVDPTRGPPDNNHQRGGFGMGYGINYAVAGTHTPTTRNLFTSGTALGLSAQGVYLKLNRGTGAFNESTFYLIAGAAKPGLSGAGQIAQGYRSDFKVLGMRLQGGVALQSMGYTLTQPEQMADPSSGYRTQPAPSSISLSHTTASAQAGTLIDLPGAGNYLRLSALATADLFGATGESTTLSHGVGLNATLVDGGLLWSTTLTRAGGSRGAAPERSSLDSMLGYQTWTDTNKGYLYLGANAKVLTCDTPGAEPGSGCSLVYGGLIFGGATRAW